MSRLELVLKSKVELAVKDLLNAQFLFASNNDEHVYNFKKLLRSVYSEKRFMVNYCLAELMEEVAKQYKNYYPAAVLTGSELIEEILEEYMR